MTGGEFGGAEEEGTEVFFFGFGSGAGDQVGPFVTGITAEGTSDFETSVGCALFAVFEKKAGFRKGGNRESFL